MGSLVASTFLRPRNSATGMAWSLAKAESAREKSPLGSLRWTTMRGFADAETSSATRAICSGSG